MKPKVKAAPATKGGEGMAARAGGGGRKGSEGSKILPPQNSAERKRIAEIDRELAVSSMTKSQRIKLTMEQAALEYAMQCETARLRLDDPATPPDERERLAKALSPFNDRDAELMEDGQCRDIYRRLLAGNKWKAARPLLQKMAIALLDPRNQDKILALMALKSLSSASPGKKWAKAVEWLLIRWGWILLTPGVEAEAYKEIGFSDAEPWLCRKPNKEQRDLIQRLLWDLLPLPNSNERQWERSAQDDLVKEAVIDGTYKSAALGAELGMSDSAIRQRQRRDKVRRKSGG